MSEAAINFQTLLRQARRLPARARRELAESLLHPSSGDEQTVVIAMRRLQPATQARFQVLMDRHNAGRLGVQEREELHSLVARYEDLMLSNTETLLKATHPELFTASGRLRLKALERAQRRRTRAIAPPSTD